MKKFTDEQDKLVRIEGCDSILNKDQQRELFSNLTKLNMSDDETLFNVRKSAKIAQIIIDTHKDIADIFADPNCHLMEKKGKAYDLAFERGAEIQRISGIKFKGDK